MVQTGIPSTALAACRCTCLRLRQPTATLKLLRKIKITKYVCCCAQGGRRNCHGNVEVPEKDQHWPTTLRWRRPESLRHPFDGELSIRDVHDGGTGDLAYPPLELLVARGHDVAPVLFGSLFAVGRRVGW